MSKPARRSARATLSCGDSSLWASLSALTTDLKIRDKYLDYFLSHRDFFLLVYVEGGYVAYQSHKRLDDLAKLAPRHEYLFTAWQAEMMSLIKNLCINELALYCADNQSSPGLIIGLIR